MSQADPTGATEPRRLELFKFYEEAARHAKTEAWAQTSWILTVSGAVFGFSVNLYVEHRTVDAFGVITWACAAAGVLFSAYVSYVLHQLAQHIQRYWTSANRVAAPDEFLRSFMSTDDAAAILKGEYPGAPYPAFIIRLFLPPLAFAIGHVAWAWYVAGPNA